MTSLNKDKNLSGILILFTLGFILFLAGSNEALVIEESMTIKDSISHILKFYLDVVIITIYFNPLTAGRSLYKANSKVCYKSQICH